MRNSKKSLVALVAVAAFLSACSASPSASNSPSNSASPTDSPQVTVTPSDYFQRLTDAKVKTPDTSLSYVNCSTEGVSVKYLNQIVLEAAEINEIYMVATAACTLGDQVGPEKVEILHWNVEENTWAPIATVRLSNKDYTIPWNTESACFEENGAVKCPVFVTKPNGKTKNGTLTVTRDLDHFWAEISY